jgi:hypothetical protein
LPGYSNRIIHVPFPDLTEDQEKDPIWLSIRNPQYMSPNELRPQDVVLKEDGTPEDPAAAQEAMYAVYAKLIIGWRVYDPGSIQVDPETGVELDMVRLPSPPTAELVARLPMVIIKKLSEVIKNAINPPSDSASPTTKTSSSSPSPSTTEHGPVVQFPGKSATLS